MIHQDIKNLIDSQIAVQTVKPTEDDIIPYSCLFSTNQDGVLSYKSGKDVCVPRVDLLYEKLNWISLPKNISFLFLTHDYSDPVHYDNKNNFSLCFGKLESQPFITIPNLHLLIGHVDILLLEVNKFDIPTQQKQKKSIFAGGPNCYQNGARIRYGISGIDPSIHVYFLSNQSIVSIQQQLQYLCTITIDGHSLCYDRLYWQMASNSLPIYIERNQDITQVHDVLIKPNIHYIESTVEGWQSAFHEMLEDMEKVENIVKNGKSFINEHFGYSAQHSAIEILEYTIHKIAKAQSTN